MATLNRSILQSMALSRLEDAKALLNTGRFSAAYYLAGYSVECGIKACFAKQVKAHDFPEKGKADKIFTHDLVELIRLAGLDASHKKDCELDPDFDTLWSTVSGWEEKSRYDPLWLDDPLAMESKATALIRAIEDADHGVLRWLKKYW